MSGGLVSAGLFGKLPAHGDFVARGDPALVAWFDRWLTDELGRVSARREGGFDRLLANAPVWRFAVRHGDATIAGAMFPSGDGVGRMFPLLVFGTSDAAQALDHADRIAVLPIDRTTTADQAVAAVADIAHTAAVDDAFPLIQDTWCSDAGDVLMFDALPVGNDFARLFEIVQAEA